MTTLTWGDPQLHFWLRHTRKAQEPIFFFGAEAERITSLLEEQIVTAVANPDESTFRRAGMIGLSEGALLQAGDSAAQVAQLTAYYQRLQVGGKLAFALPVPSLEWLGRAASAEGYAAPMVEVASAEQGERLYRWRTTRCDPIAQLLHHHDIEEATDAAGITLRRWHTHTQEYYAFPNEVRLMLERVGFLIEAVYGGWSDEPLQQGASLQVWVTRKGA